MSICLLATDKSSRQKTSKYIVDLHKAINAFYLMDMTEYFIQQLAKYTFFSNLPGTLTKKNHILCQKTQLNNF